MAMAWLFAGVVNGPTEAKRQLEVTRKGAVTLTKTVGRICRSTRWKRVSGDPVATIETSKCWESYVFVARQPCSPIMFPGGRSVATR